MKNFGIGTADKGETIFFFYKNVERTTRPWNFFILPYIQTSFFWVYLRILYWFHIE